MAPAGGRRRVVREAASPTPALDAVHELTGLLAHRTASRPGKDSGADLAGSIREAVDRLLAAAGETGPGAAAAFARTTTATLAEADRASEQAALARAGRLLNESLDLETVLTRICEEASNILAADTAAVYLGSAEDGVVISAVHQIAPEVVGYRLAPGAGLAGRVLVANRPVLAADYHAECDVPADSPFGLVRSSLGVPIRWNGEFRGVLSLGYLRPTELTGRMLELLSDFAEFAAVACSNASAHAGLAHSARTDGLTGCLTHAALHAALAEEIERMVRGGGGRLSLVLLDLDEFKSVNEDHGHLTGDEVLRRVGRSLRDSNRPYDKTARYGGDEFAIVAVESGEAEAAEMGRRAIGGMSEALASLQDVRMGRATAGVAEWEPGLSPVDLIARADQALLWGKQRCGRGDAVGYSSLPDTTGGPAVHALPAVADVPDRVVLEFPDASRDADGPLRKRTRHLALANELGARLSAMTDCDRVLDAAVEGLHLVFGYRLAGAYRLGSDGHIHLVTGRGRGMRQLRDSGWSQPAEIGLIGRCLREGRAVVANDVRSDPDFIATLEVSEVRSALIVPLRLGEEPWGVLNIEADTTQAFDEDDLRLAGTLAGQVGAALRSADLYEQLERAYLGTAEVLAAAMETRDTQASLPARSLVDQAERVGRRLGLDEIELRDLRFGAAFHDIGKFSVPDSILAKSGPLTPAERSVMERHSHAGEQILAPISFLTGVRKVMRHKHERWDGTGYPDGLAGSAIPLGSRVIFVCDALQAMTSDRPHSPALSHDAALAELRRGAGSQFDPTVVEALLVTIGPGTPA
jgi:diguanylate cyclase (GGDEF)-like protein